MHEPKSASSDADQKNDAQTQFAALCYRVRHDKVQVLLITSRASKRWIVPKGWPIEAHSPAASARQEAWEEGGVIGQAESSCLGVYSYAKDVGSTDDVPCRVMLYPVRVKSLAKRYPEQHQRRRRWVSRKKAARLVAEPELARMILDFDPQARSTVS
jgi:8-oxo-dGTP pyrophosphatase MutT (NUDIX family)